MAFVHLKNAHLVDNSTVGFTRTTVTRVASEQIGADLYRQVNEVTVFVRPGKSIEVVTVNDVSRDECSMGGVDVFVVAQRLGGR